MSLDHVLKQLLWSLHFAAANRNLAAAVEQQNEQRLPSASSSYASSRLVAADLWRPMSGKSGVLGMRVHGARRGIYAANGSRQSCKQLAQSSGCKMYCSCALMHVEADSCNS